MLPGNWDEVTVALVLNLFQVSWQLRQKKKCGRVIRPSVYIEALCTSGATSCSMLPTCDITCPELKTGVCLEGLTQLRKEDLPRPCEASRSLAPSSLERMAPA